MISVWPKFYSFDPEMVLHFRFTFKPFSGLVQKRERARERERKRQHEREIAPAPSTGEGKINPHPRAPMNPENPGPSSFVEQCPNRQIMNPFVRLRTQKSSDREPIPQIVELVRWTHSLDCEPRNRQTHLSPIVANPEIIAPFVKSIHQTRDCPAESPICLLWVDPSLGRSRADPLALFDLWFSWCCCGSMGGSCFVVLWFWVDFWFDEFFFVGY